MAEQTLEQMIAQIQKNTAPEPKSQLGRTVLQGLTFGTADELEAWLKTSTDEEYQELVNEIRGNLDQYANANPIKAGVAEVGGAILPSIIATIMSGGAALPAIGARLMQNSPLVFKLLTKGLGNVLGTRNVQSLMGAAAVGAGQGALTGYGKGTGGALDRSRIEGALTGGTTGAITGGGFNIAGRFAGSAVDGIINYARQKFGNRAGTAVAREIQKLAQERGISPEQAFQDIQNGHLMVENVTLRDIMRTYRAEGGAAAEELRTGLADRPATTATDVRQYLERTMSGASDENILIKQAERLTDLKDKASALYQGPMGQQPVPQESLTALASIFKRVPEVFDTIKAASKIRGKGTFFDIDSKGRVQITGTPTVQQLEEVRKVVAERAGKLKDRNAPAGSYDVGEALSDVERELRGIIDNLSDETKQARETYRKMMVESDSFDAGRAVTKNNPDIDLLEQEWDKALAGGDEAIKAFRLGVLSKLRNRLRSGQKATLIRNMLDPEKSEYLLLQQVFPEQDLPDMLRKLSVAKEANDAATEILKQSPTAITSALQKKSGSNVDLGDFIMSPDLYGMARIALGILGKQQTGLTEAQKVDFVKTMVRSNADEIRSILSDTNGYSNLERYILNAFSSTQRLGPKAVIAVDDADQRIENMRGAIGAGVR